MEDVIRNVNEIDSTDRQAIEHLLGEPLRENQQVMIRVITSETESSGTEKAVPGAATALPDWCNVYEGLSESEIADLEQIVLTRADLSRPTE
jgi:hypothetical protein